MKLIDINKARYRRYIKIVMAACAIGLTVCSLALSQLLIALFPDDDGSHFHWNLLGVVVGALIIVSVLKKIRHHEFMKEVVYVWELKQALNKITRKMPALEKAAKTGEPKALLAIHFSYRGSRQLWTLDNNTLTMDELAIKEIELKNLAQQFNVSLNVDDYNESILQEL